MDDSPWRTLARELAGRLVASGDVRDEAWREAFKSVPRHLFVPRFFLSHPESGYRAVEAGDPDYLAAVYSNEALITQFDGQPDAWERIQADRDYTPTRDDGLIGGLPSASSSSPGLMAGMLETLGVGDTDRVLEIGTGSGYNAAILCHRLGDGRVTTVDVDPVLVSEAQERLAPLGYRPRVAVADALTAVPDGPYDAMIVTVGLPRVPAPLITSARAGGTILACVSTGLTNHGVARLTVDPDGTARGRIAMGARFMPTRDHPSPHSFDLLSRLDVVTGERSATCFDPAVLEDWSGFAVFAGLLLPDLVTAPFAMPGRPGDYWFIATDGSWAYRETRGDTALVTQGGPRHLWTEVERLWDTWRSIGTPAPERFGVTVKPDGTHVLWLDYPDGEHTWPILTD